MGTFDDIDTGARVIEYGDKFVIAYPRKGVYEFTGGIVYRSQEAAETGLESDIAFHKKFWGDQLANRSNAVVADGTHYRVSARTPSNKSHAGFGGREWKFRNLETGEVTTSDNVWFQGDIPDPFRFAFPDTHEVVA
jgi:hypothetical protein